MSEIKMYHDMGMNDSDIATLVNRRKNLVSHYRDKILNLEPRWVRRNYKTVEDKIRGYMIRNIKFSANRRGIEFNLKYSDIELPTHCPLLGLKLKYKEFALKASDFNNDSWATLDRLDNSIGYVAGNVWVVSRLANSMKNSASLEQLEIFCNSMLIKLKNHRALGGVTDSCESRPLVVAPSNPSPDKLGSG